MQNPQSLQTPVVFKGKFPLLGVALWIIAIIPVLAFFFIEPTTLGWFESLGLITRVKNNDYVAGRFIAGGLALVATIVTMVLRKKIEVSEEGITMPRGKKLGWEDVRMVQIKAGDVLEIISATDSQKINTKDFSLRTLQRLLRQMVDQHPNIRLNDELGWLQQDRERDKRWYRSSRLSTATTYTVVIAFFAFIPCLIYFGCWVRPSGVSSDLRFIVKKTDVPRKLGWWDHQGYYGAFDPNHYRIVEGASFTGDLDSSDIEVILFDPSIWSFEPGDTCHVEVAKTSMMASLFVPRNGYYVTNVLSQSRSR